MPLYSGKTYKVVFVIGDKKSWMTMDAANPGECEEVFNRAFPKATLVSIAESKVWMGQKSKQVKGVSIE